MTTRRGLFGWIAAAFCAMSMRQAQAIPKPDGPFWPDGTSFWEPPRKIVQRMEPDILLSQYSQVSADVYPEIDSRLQWRSTIDRTWRYLTDREYPMPQTLGLPPATVFGRPGEARLIGSSEWWRLVPKNAQISADGEYYFWCDGWTRVRSIHR